ncbi:Protein of unknown function DUF3433 [Penicillium italicum]|uniref:Uncharacterized protein n=1 Tax=Penicillium italicum TaxID=40296 RepID=A0A0A2L7Z1_PENIT|nr:Protein of unknown function DUF3433 [Penicillium italicum]
MAARLMNKGLTEKIHSSDIGQAIVNKSQIFMTQLSLRVMEGFSIKAEGDDVKNLDEQDNHTTAFALLLAALEIALHVSQKDDGLGNVSANEYQHCLWTTLPSLVMGSVGLFSARMDFNTRSLALYAQLKRPTGALFEESITVNSLDSLAITNITRSIRTRQFAIIANTLTALGTSFLVIVTSGLYSVNEVPNQISVNFTQDTTFCGGDLANDDHSSVMAVTKDFLQKNRNFLSWTHAELTFPELSTDNFTKVEHGNESVYQLSVLAPSMPCSLADQDRGSTSLIPSLAVLTSAGLFGKSSMLPCGNSNSYNAKPATLYFWGNIQNDSTENISAMTYIEAAETVDTLTRFQLPGFEITDGNPPVPEELSARSAPDVDVPWISWNNFDTPGSIAANSNLDWFFTALVMGEYAIAAGDLVNPGSSDIVIRAINHQDRILKAQVFNKYTRDAASTRVLEALLASILVLSIVCSILMSTDQILPKNPTSIAAVASLLADSKILARYETVMGDSNEQPFGQDISSRCRFFLGFQRDASDKGDPWQLSEDHGCEKYCVYFSERDDETMSGKGSMWMSKEFRAKETRVEERLG